MKALPHFRFILYGLFLVAGGGAMAGENEVTEVVQWQVGPVVLRPGPAGSFDEVAVKDPSIVFAEGRWHLFYTARSRKAYSLGYVGAKRLAGLAGAKRVCLQALGGRKDGYAAAPQVFFFAPRKTWYLIYQTRDTNYQPVYATTKTIGRPESWSRPKNLVEKKDRAKWIDFWVICDERKAYFFYTRAHRDVYVITTDIDDFPNGFAKPQKVFGPVHEAVHIYKVKGATTYHLLYEMRGPGSRRLFGLAEAKQPSGPWRKVKERYAAGEQLVYAEGADRWTEEVSHGELIRSGYDQNLKYEPRRTRFLIQGLRAGTHQGEYTQLPWSLGLIEKK